MSGRPIKRTLRGVRAVCSFQYLATHDVLGDWSWCSEKQRPTYGPLSARHHRFVRRSAGSQQGDSSWRYPAFTINPDWTAFSVSKIPSITFCLPPNNASGPPPCRLLKGGS